MADTYIERETSAAPDNTAGWSVAVLVLLAVVVLGALYVYYHRGGNVPGVPNTGTPNSTNVNVTVPNTDPNANQIPASNPGPGMNSSGSAGTPNSSGSSGATGGSPNSSGTTY